MKKKEQEKKSTPKRQRLSDDSFSDVNGGWTIRSVLGKVDAYCREQNEPCRRDLNKVLDPIGLHIMSEEERKDKERDCSELVQKKQ